MSAFTEFLLVAFIIYLWESGLWLPMRSVLLRRKWWGGKWNIVHPGHWWSTRHLGLVAMFPVIPDGRLAPCQAPPLRVDENGKLLLDISESESVPCEAADWSALHEEATTLAVEGTKVRISSPRALDMLRRGKNAGLSPAAATGRMWRHSLSPSMARREWRRWRMVSRPIQPVCFILTVGFFAGLPTSYLYGGVYSALITLAALWLSMGMIAGHLWWLGSRVYPSVKPAFRSDALLSLFVPFHAMRAMEIASVHAMAGTHPAALLIGTGDLENPWLARFVREVSHPRPEAAHDEARCSAIRPYLISALARTGRTPADYETIPSREEDPEATTYCPRCHGLFSGGATHCTDCRGIRLKPF